MEQMYYLDCLLSVIQKYESGPNVLYLEFDNVVYFEGLCQNNAF